MYLPTQSIVFLFSILPLLFALAHLPEQPAPLTLESLLPFPLLWTRCPTTEALRLFLFTLEIYTVQVHISCSVPLTVRTYHLQLWALRLTSTAHAFEYTTDTFTYKNNQVIIQARIPANSPPPWRWLQDVQIQREKHTALVVNPLLFSQYGSQVSIYACVLYGYQDTLLVSDGTQVVHWSELLSFLRIHLVNHLTTGRYKLHLRCVWTCLLLREHNSRTASGHDSDDNTNFWRHQLSSDPYLLDTFENVTGH